MEAEAKNTSLGVATIERDRGNANLTINSHGAKIEELTLGGQKIFTKVQRGDGKEGCAHPCIPQLGPETTTSFELPQHGSARGQDFNLVSSDDEIVLSRDIEEKKYPKGLHIEQKHNLSDNKYSLTTTVSNNGDQEAPVNFAEHFYWYAPDGWVGVTVNGVNVEDMIKQDKAIPLQAENRIEIPGQKPIILKQKGFSVLQLWVGKNSKTGEYDENYICMEPAEGNHAENFFGSEKSMIKPGDKRKTEVTISLAD